MKTKRHAPKNPAHKKNRITFRVTDSQFASLKSLPRLERRHLPETFRHVLAEVLKTGPNGKTKPKARP